MGTSKQIGPTVGYATVNLEGGDNQFESSDSKCADPPNDGCAPYDTHKGVNVGGLGQYAVKPGPVSDRANYGK